MIWRVEGKGEIVAVLSKKDWAFWEENGYVVVHDAVPQENLDAMVDAIWTFLEIDRDDWEQWYRHKPYTRETYGSSPIAAGGNVEFYQHQALWDNRQYPKVHQAFSEIWGTEKLWVSVDRACMKLPVREDNPDYNYKGFVHWDVDTAQPVPFGVQGVLYLTDTAEDQGGFQCVPGFHRTFYEWVKTQPEDRHPRRPDLQGLEVKPIAGQAGDLLIWHRLLLHGNGRNRSDKPRFAQYINMSPAGDSIEKRQSAIKGWQERRATAGWPGDARDWEHKNQQPAVLTELGRKLLGVDSWS